MQIMKRLKQVLIGILKYILGLVLLIFSLIFLFEGVGEIRDEIITFGLITFFFLPLILVFSKRLSTGLLIFFSSLLALNVLLPTLDWSRGSPIPKFDYMNIITPKKQDSRPKKSLSKVIGKYSTNKGGLTYTIYWYGDSFIFEVVNDFGGEILDYEYCEVLYNNENTRKAEVYCDQYTYGEVRLIGELMITLDLSIGQFTFYIN